MRKVQKALALELLQMLADSHKSAACYMEQKMQDAVLTVLNDCQQSAIQLGEFIENIESEDDPAVHELEAYCETLYQMSQDLPNTAPFFEGMKRLDEALTRVERHITQEIPTTLEIVFLPYKASMWDSMESIWRAADADPRCDAYVVPIAYYDRNSNFRLGTRHYEGALYPPDVPVIHYDKYDLEKRRPDAVFIHNPYDDCNRVTSVDPEYYSDKVKAYTDCLVYVDYGVPYWIPLKPVEPRVFAPAYLQCDFSIFHSVEFAEQVRACVLGQLQPEFREEVGQKIVALGSAKFDAVIHTSRENCPLPDRWRQLINGRKVILYSTTLKAMLQHSAQFIMRLKDDLKAFQKQKDIALWWRPHPFSEATLLNMHPGLMQEYKRIVDQYQQEGWGIYDETADFHRAISWSDGCYTDESSLMFLYLATGKPFACRTFRPMKHQVSEPSQDFTPILGKQITHMQAARGANVYHGNYVIWWHCFADRDFRGSTQYDNFLERFSHFLLHEEQYPQAEQYRQLKRRMFHDCIVNPDGTAGEKIYALIKQKVLG